VSEWGDAAQAFESSLMILRKDKNGWVIGFSVHPNDAPEALLDAPLGTRFQIVCFQIGDDEEPVIPEAVRTGKKAVAVAGEMCREKTFQDWLHSLAGEPTSLEGSWASDEVYEEHTAMLLRGELGIKSRADLLNDTKAQNRFRELIVEYRGKTRDG